MTGLLTLAVAVLLALGFGLYRSRTDGRARAVTGTAPAHAWEAELGERATFVQFSSPTCAPCRGTQRLLSDLVAEQPGLAHLDVDVSERLDLAEAHGVLRTPTVLVLDAGGRVRQRIVGAPSRDQALEALAAVA